jgi:predicted Zn-dependent peptidase
LAALLGPTDPVVRDLDPARVAVSDLDAFRDAHYVASGATLIVGGNFDRARIESEIRELWGAWPRRSPPAHRTTTAEMPHGPVILAEDDDDATQVHVRIRFGCPRRGPSSIRCARSPRRSSRRG